MNIKIIAGYRRLDGATIPDQASIGDRDEILAWFGGRQRFAGICDGAGGSYQFCVHPADHQKNAFVLSTSMGGTLFQWRVAP